MVGYNKKIGTHGENLAQSYLEKLGYKILANNFRCKVGEIDIITLFPNTNYICFVEVKSRFTSVYGRPCESITYKKILNLRHTAEFYIMKNKLYNYNFRFDVIEIIFNNNNTDYLLEHIKNAF
ncbi:YraN family protein [Clostridium ganghwense]|uniref:UPF0102 protein OXH55_17350 n=1 Tax=Clostridium ganghwense TaxID=312089 RepID=A0ABT4CTK0_9CLOT|nr:YraN family protein [Clostridium ganghwense]MCY6372398.1 YraN family protein [Clostridium ganghwense]